MFNPLVTTRHYSGFPLNDHLERRTTVALFYISIFLCCYVYIRVYLAWDTTLPPCLLIIKTKCKKIIFPFSSLFSVALCVPRSSYTYSSVFSSYIAKGLKKNIITWQLYYIQNTRCIDYRNPRVIFLRLTIVLILSRRNRRQFEKQKIISHITKKKKDRIIAFSKLSYLQ